MIWYWGAAALSLAIALLHVFGGGPSIARPLLGSELEPEPKYVSYYCWHLVSLTLVAMAVAFALAATFGDQWAIGGMASVLAASFALWGLVLGVTSGQGYRVIPQGWLFVPVAVLGGLGFVG